jgi:4-carboxymuconolactone decarboxylase
MKRRHLNFLPYSVLAASILAATVAWAQAASSADEAMIEISSSDSRSSSRGASTNFTGHAQVEQLFGARGSSRLTGGMVIFQPGARSSWHTHPLGQILIVTAGTGLVQQWGGPMRMMKAGDVVWIPAGVKHWHGATPNSSVTHLAIQEVANGKNVDWMEPVSDKQYMTDAPKTP